VDNAARSFRSLACQLGMCAVALAPAPVSAQVSPEEHAKHHPAPAPGKPGTIPPAGPMSGMTGGMEGMMEGLGRTPPKELFPSMMDPHSLMPEQRERLEGLARERMAAGTAEFNEGLARFEAGAQAGDQAAMREGLDRMLRGLDLLESGESARQALSDPGTARVAALQWFKREMDLERPSATETGGGIFGLSWFHFFVMLLLGSFAAAMVWMYFHKMRRASDLLQALTGTPAAIPTSAVATAAPPSPGPPVTELSGGPTSSATSRWSGRLRVARIFQETPDVKTFRLMNPLGGVLPLAYLPGQFLTLTVLIDGKPVRRAYTIASSPTQHDYVEVTVKHEEGGLVSGHLHDRVREGDLLDCSGPNGSLIFTGRECKCILLIGGGVGITPLMSVLRYLTDRAWSGDIYLLYGVHAPQDIIFREELEYLRRRHPNLRVVVIVSHPEGTDWTGPTGRITKELIASSVPDLASRYVHLCGPVPLMEAVKKALAELGVPLGRVKTEAFGPALGKPVPPAPAPETAPVAGAAGFPTVSFTQSNKAASLPPDVPVLDVADAIGVEIDNSCRVGVCGLCRVKLLSGTVTMAVEEGLEPGDKEKNIILACQAKSSADVAVEA
jgi:ferredoxin-NADP reductase